MYGLYNKEGKHEEGANGTHSGDTPDGIKISAKKETVGKEEKKKCCQK